MSSQAGLVLKKAKEKPLLQHHHWIYSGAIQSLPDPAVGSIVPVFSSSGKKLGLAGLNSGRSIAAHMLAFGEETIEEALRDRIRKGVALRRRIFNLKETNAFRLINAEGDNIPGLIVDQYDQMLVIQLSHSALEPLRERIISLLIEEVAPAGIYEKSTSFLRKKEGMEEVQAHLWGEKNPNPIILENGLSYRVDLERGQKTGFFLDQREMRKFVGELSSGRRVLNLFSYTGGFTVAALKGHAKSVDSVEISAKCGPLVDENLSLNGCNLEQHRFICQDAFDFLKESPLAYDLAILDPPAFAKKRNDVPAAFRAYKDLNQVVMQRLPPGSLLLTCSCSYQIDTELFQNILFRAALEANRRIRIVGKHRQAIDHPVSIYHPESVYLKSLLLYLD
jgi:23S rRNA (cytosine1962-C5)-methyltransferase